MVESEQHFKSFRVVVPQIPSEFLLAIAAQTVRAVVGLVHIVAAVHHTFGELAMLDGKHVPDFVRGNVDEPPQAELEIRLRKMFVLQPVNRTDAYAILIRSLTENVIPVLVGIQVFFRNRHERHRIVGNGGKQHFF